MFIRCRKLNISLVFITQPYFSVPKDIRLNSTHYLIMKINNRKELQNIAINDNRYNTTEQTKFEYSPLGKIFNKGLSKDHQKEGLFKRLKSIEHKN